MDQSVKDYLCNMPTAVLNALRATNANLKAEKSTVEASLKASIAQKSEQMKQEIKENKDKHETRISNAESAVKAAQRNSDDVNFFNLIAKSKAKDYLKTKTTVYEKVKKEPVPPYNPSEKVKQAQKEIDELEEEKCQLEEEIKANNVLIDREKEEYRHYFEDLLKVSHLNAEEKKEHLDRLEEERKEKKLEEERKEEELEEEQRQKNLARENMRSHSPSLGR